MQSLPRSASNFPEVNSPPSSDLIHLTLPYGAESAKNLSVEAIVSLLFLRRKTNTASEKSSVKANQYLKSSLEAGSTGPARSVWTNSSRIVVLASGFLFLLCVSFPSIHTLQSLGLVELICLMYLPVYRLHSCVSRTPTFYYFFLKKNNFVFYQTGKRPGKCQIPPKFICLYHKIRHVKSSNIACHRSNSVNANNNG